MRIRLANDSDNQALLDFFSQNPIKGKLQYFIKRKLDFFSLYKMQSRDFLTFILEDTESQNIFGCASFIIKNSEINGKNYRVAWATDLRISNDRRAILGWSQHFSPLLTELREKQGITYFFSVLNLADTQILNTFIRARNSKRNLPRYHLMRKFNLVSVHGHYPWSDSKLDSIEISAGRTQDFADMTAYLQKQAKKRILNTDWRVSTLFEKLRLWKGFSIENFLIARHKIDQEIVGCVLPWSPVNVQDYIPIEYTRVADNFRQFLKFGDFFGFSRRLTKSSKKSGKEEKLSLTFLTHFFADNEFVMEALLEESWNAQKDNEFLIYSYFKSERHLKPPPSWISVEHQFGVYCMMTPDEVLPDFLNPSQDEPVELDPQFI